MDQNSENIRELVHSAGTADKALILKWVLGMRRIMFLRLTVRPTSEGGKREDGKQAQKSTRNTCYLLLEDTRRFSLSSN